MPRKVFSPGGGCDRITEKNNMQEAEGDNTMLTNKDILQIALQQSAYDMGCSPEDFLSEENMVVISGKHPLARKYLPLPYGYFAGYRIYAANYGPGGLCGV